MVRIFLGSYYSDFLGPNQNKKSRTYFQQNTGSFKRELKSLDFFGNTSANFVNFAKLALQSSGKVSLSFFCLS